METTTERFNAIRWHDSKIRGINILRTQSGEEIRLAAEVLDRQSRHIPTTVVFVDCTFLKMQVDLDAKAECSDDISDAKCVESSPWLTELAHELPYKADFTGYLHFWIELCPYGGMIDILAKDFRLELVPGEE